MDPTDSTVSEPKELQGRWRWLAGGMAVLLTLAVVGGFVFVRLGVGKSPGVTRGVGTVTGIDFKCRLPVVAGASGGFISFPDGAITIDPKVNVNFNKGGYGFTYDAQVGQWVPVPKFALSPDGRYYAYLAQTTGVPGEAASMSLHTHEIVSGKDRVLWEGGGYPMGPNFVTWLPEGIYFSTVLGDATGPIGPVFPAVYVADPNKPGTPRRVGPNPPPQPPTAGQSNFSGPDVFTLVGGGAAWATGQRIQTEVPSPDKPPAPGTFGPDRIIRMDLHDGSVSTWYSVNTTELVSLMGLDEQGRPILALFQPTFKQDAAALGGPPPMRMLLLTGAGQTTEITSANPDFHPGSSPSADSHGIWFGSWNSLWLYTQGAGFRQVATIPAGVFPSPSPPPPYQQKGPMPSGAGPGMPSYMQGTLVTPAGSCT